MSRTQVLLTKISQTCQSIRNMRKTREQLAFHRTNNTSNRTTSCSSQQGHSSLHSGTGDEGGRDIARRRAIAPLHRQWVAHTILAPQHIVIPSPLLLTQHQLLDHHHQEGILALLHLTTKEVLCLHPDTLGRIPGHASLTRISTGCIEGFSKPENHTKKA